LSALPIFHFTAKAKCPVKFETNYFVHLVEAAKLHKRQLGHALVLKHHYKSALSKKTYE